MLQPLTPAVWRRRLIVTYALSVAASVVILWPIVGADSSIAVQGIYLLVTTFWIASFIHLSWSASPQKERLWLWITSILSFVLPLSSTLLLHVPPVNALASSGILGVLGTSVALYIMRRKRSAR